MPARNETNYSQFIRSIWAMLLAGCIGSLGFAGMVSAERTDSENPNYAGAIIKQVQKMIKSTTLPLVNAHMTTFEQKRIISLVRRKSAILKRLKNFDEGVSSIIDGKLKGFGNSLPLYGAIGAFVEASASVRHLWASKFKWLGFKSKCKSSQACIFRVKKLNSAKSHCLCRNRHHSFLRHQSPRL